MKITTKEKCSVFQEYGEEMLQALSPPSKLKKQQLEALQFIRQWFAPGSGVDKEVCTIVLPTGCGKSGVAVFTPYFVKSRKTMIVSPNR
jgi:superfamily II DNA or RNA helicase